MLSLMSGCKVRHHKIVEGETVQASACTNLGLHLFCGPMIIFRDPYV